MKHPNILFVLADDQRFDTIAALGNRHIQTPNLDRLVEEGTTFSRAHIGGGTSSAVCMPSRAMIHTGRDLFRIGGRGENIPESHTTLGEHLRRAGYETYGIGKWHNGSESYARSFSGGAEIFFGGMDDHWNVPACHFDPTGRYDVHRPFVPDFMTSNKLRQKHCDHVSIGVHSTDLFAGAAVDFLWRERGDRPFFAYVSLMAPHDPRTMPDAFRQLYDPASIEIPANFQPRHAIDTGALDVRDERLAAFPREPEEIRRHIAEYYAMITHLDDALGQIRQALKDSGRSEDTLIVFAGDNGLALGQHGLMGKQNLYDHSLRVPLILAGPGVPRNHRVEELCQLNDIFPTLCGLCGLDIPESVGSQNLMPLLEADGSSAGRDSLYLAYESSIRGVTTGSFKLIEYACGQTQLFDLEKDPLEIVNLAGEAGNCGLVQEMRGLLVRHFQTNGEQAHSYGLDFWHARQDLYRLATESACRVPAGNGCASRDTGSVSVG